MQSSTGEVVLALVALPLIKQDARVGQEHSQIRKNSNGG